MTTQSRDISVDAIKGCLIILVFAGHLIEVCGHGNAAYRTLDTVINSFHMPLFLFTVGMFARAEPGERDYRAMFSQLLLPLLVFQLAYLVPLRLVTGKWLATPMEPYFHLWFLLAVMLMKLALPVVVRVPFAVPVSIAATLIAGYDPGLGFSFALSRTLYFFPFFLLGFRYGHTLLAYVRQHRLLFGILFAEAVAASMLWAASGLDPNVLKGAVGYAERAVFTDAPLAGRAVALGLALCGALGFASLVPARRTLAWLGQRTFAVYVLHGYVVLALARIAPGLREPIAGLLLPAWLLLAAAGSYLLACADDSLKRVFVRWGDALMQLARGNVRHALPGTGPVTVDNPPGASGQR